MLIGYVVVCHTRLIRAVVGQVCFFDFQSATLQHYSRYSKSELEAVVCHLAKNLNSASTNTYQQAVKSKYSSQRLMRISQVIVLLMLNYSTAVHYVSEFSL